MFCINLAMAGGECWLRLAWTLARIVGGVGRVLGMFRITAFRTSHLGFIAIFGRNFLTSSGLKMPIKVGQSHTIQVYVMEK